MLRIISFILAIAVFASCKTIHNLAAKDNSGSKRTTESPKTKQNGNVVFIDNIEVTPGNTVTSRQSPNTTQAKRKKEDYVSNAVLKENNAFGNIENADALQLKYSVMLDASVEKLGNVAMLKSIDDWWATKYCYGGDSKSCIDCSAFTRTVIKDVYSIELPRTAKEQFEFSQKIEVEELKEGDLVFFQTTGRSISHVGIYLMNNKFVHAAVSQGVSISDLNDVYWKTRYRGAGRITKEETPIKP